MENRTEILSSFKHAFADLEKAISRFNETSFNVKPEGSNWSPAMVVQHLVLAGRNFDKILLGNTAPTAGLADAKVAQLKEIFLNYDLKMTSPEFKAPADDLYNSEELISELNGIGAAVASAISKVDLTATCLDFEFPGLGHVTGIEAVYFLIYHSQRHTHQLSEMANKLS